MNDIIEAFNTLAAALDQRADWLEDQQAGGQKSDKVLVRQAVADYRYLASVARVDTCPAAFARGRAATR
jgi:hypothetical protein